MSRSKKIWLGIFTFLPVIGFGLYFLFFFTFFLNIAGDEVEHVDELPANFMIMFLAIMLAVISSFAMMIYYLIHVNRSDKKSDHKLIWILILVLASGIGNVAYYFVEILGFGKSKEASPNE